MHAPTSLGPDAVVLFPHRERTPTSLLMLHPIALQPIATHALFLTNPAIRHDAPVAFPSSFPARLLQLFKAIFTHLLDTWNRASVFGCASAISASKAKISTSGKSLTLS